MAQQPPDLAAILAMLGQSSSTPQPSAPPGYPGIVPSATPTNPLAGLPLPQPTNSGNLDLSAIKPTASGNVSLADAIAKARLAAQKAASTREDPRRAYQPSRSRSPSRRESSRDNHNPFRDERRDDPRRTNGRDRSVSPPPMNSGYAPPARSSMTRTRSPPAQKQDSNSEVITVESSTVGLIIGRGGENLRRVEAATGARVQFITGPDSGAKRQCRISGTPRQRADAIKDIFGTIQQHPVSPPTKSAALPYATGSAKQRPSNAVEESAGQMMVPDRTVGLIIGRGGETIRDIQERSGCHVNITSESKSINGFRPINLIGTQQAAAEAMRMIKEVVDSDTRQGPPPAAAPPAYAPQYASPAPAYPPYDPYGVPQQAPAFVDPAKASMTDTIIVPSEAVGMIIGKGGETIKEMQATTGTKINVAPEGKGPDINREIGIIGPRHAIEEAKKAIWAKVNAVREKQGGVWTRGGEVVQVAQPYASDPYSHQQPSHGQAPQAAPAATPDPAADPYAAYGGYANYYALWQAAMANTGAQQQQQPPGY